MNWSKLLRLCYFLVSIAIGATATTDYCKVYSCGKNHIACNNNGSFAEFCPSNRRIVKIDPFKSTILNLHNSKRNEIAGGGTKNLSPAVRMAKMVWDNELAKMAELQVKTCDLNANKCRSLPRFRYSGQNNAMYSYRRAEETFSDEWLVKELVNNWIAESNNTTMKVIKKYPKNSPNPVVGHFTVIVAQSNNAVGCAAIRFRRQGVHVFMLTCNYATTNLVDRSIYRSGGEPASSCKKGRSTKYPNLCSPKEQYDNMNP